MKEKELFSNEQLKRMIAPLFLEQLLVMLVGPAFIIVIGQCMGNGDTEGAEYYFRKLTKITLWISAAWNLLIFHLTPVFLHFYFLGGSAAILNNSRADS